jgi:hypothetical protein
LEECLPTQELQVTLRKLQRSLRGNVNPLHSVQLDILAKVVVVLLSVIHRLEEVERAGVEVVVTLEGMALEFNVPEILTAPRRERVQFVTPVVDVWIQVAQ